MAAQETKAATDAGTRKRRIIAMIEKQQLESYNMSPET